MCVSVCVERAVLRAGPQDGHGALSDPHDGALTGPQDGGTQISKKFVDEIFGAFSVRLFGTCFAAVVVGHV